MTTNNWTPDKIKQLRARLGLTQTEFGARIGAALRTVQNYEAGLRTPGGAVKILLDQIAKEKPGTFGHC